MFSWRRKAPRERRSKKKIANIDLKVPDVEWQTTGRNVRPPASNENPDLPKPDCANFPNILSTICYTRLPIPLSAFGST